MKNDSGPQDVHPSRLPRGERPPFQTMVVFGVSAGSGLLLIIGLPNLMQETGFVAYLKAGVIGLVATLVAYAVARFAIERLAPLAAIGYRTALAAAILSILFVGSGMFSATFSGLTLPRISRLELEAYGAQLGAYIAGREQAAQQASRITPAMATIVPDLTAKRDCALRPSCGGLSPRERIVARRTLSEKIGRAEAIASAAEAGRARRDAAARRIADLLGGYRTTVGSSDKSAPDIWIAAQKLDAEIRQAVAALDEASPVALVRAYADELAGDGDPAIRALGASLKSVVASASAGVGAAPAFPSPPGVGRALGYIFHFLPIAAIAAVIDLIVPLLLWLIAYLSLLWAMRQSSPTPPRPPRAPTDPLQIFNSGVDPITGVRLRPGPGDMRRLTDR